MNDPFINLLRRAAETLKLAEGVARSQRNPRRELAAKRYQELLADWWAGNTEPGVPATNGTATPSAAPPADATSAEPPRRPPPETAAQPIGARGLPDDWQRRLKRRLLSAPERKVPASLVAKNLNVDVDVLVNAAKHSEDIIVISGGRRGGHSIKLSLFASPVS